MSGRDDLRSLYARYLERCNAHDFDALDAYVARDVRVNDEPIGLDGYVAGLRGVVAAFPDYHWALRHLVVDEPWLAAHFRDAGTHRGEFLGAAASHRRLTTQELALYRIEAGRIAEVWVTADNLALLRQAEAGEAA